MSVLLIVEASLFTVIVVSGFALVLFKTKNTQHARAKSINIISSIIYLFVMFALSVISTLWLSKSTKEFTTKYPDETNLATFTPQYHLDYKELKESLSYRVTLTKGFIYLLEIFFLINFVLSEIMAFFRQGKQYEVKTINMSSLTASQTESKRRAKKSLMQKRKSNLSADRANNLNKRYDKVLNSSEVSSVQGNWASKLQVNLVTNAIVLGWILSVYLIIFIAYVAYNKSKGLRLDMDDLFLPFKMANFLLLSTVMFILLLCNVYYIAVKNNNLTVFHSEFYVMATVDLIVVFFIFFITYTKLFSRVFQFIYATKPFKGEYPEYMQKYFYMIYQSVSLEQFALFRGVIYIAFCSIVKLLPFMLDMNKDRINKKGAKL